MKKETNWRPATGEDIGKKCAVSNDNPDCRYSGSWILKQKTPYGFICHGEGNVSMLTLFKYCQVEEEPTPKTLEQRIKDKWADKMVEMLGRDEDGDLVYEEMDTVSNSIFHSYAISQKGFAGYVYDDENIGLVDSPYPVVCNGGKYIFPVAVLFDKGQEQ